MVKTELPDGDRRAFLRTAGLGVVGLALGCVPEVNLVTPRDAPFLALLADGSVAPPAPRSRGPRNKAKRSS